MRVVVRPQKTPAQQWLMLLALLLSVAMVSAVDDASGPAGQAPPPPLEPVDDGDLTGSALEVPPHEPIVPIDANGDEVAFSAGGSGAVDKDGDTYYDAREETPVEWGFDDDEETDTEEEEDEEVELAADVKSKIRRSFVDETVMWLCAVEPNDLEQSRAHIAGLFRECLKDKKLRTHFKFVRGDGNAAGGGGGIADAISALLSDDGLEVTPSAADSVITSYLCGQWEDSSVPRWEVANVFFAIAQRGGRPANDPEAREVVTNWIKNEGVDKQPRAYEALGIPFQDGVNLLATAKDCEPFHFNAASLVTKQALRAVVLPALEKKAAAAAGGQILDLVSHAARYVNRWLLEDKRRFLAKYAEWFQMRDDKYRKHLSANMDLSERNLEEADAHFFAITLEKSRRLSKPLVFEPLTEAERAASRYYIKAPADVEFGVDLVHYLDTMKHSFHHGSDYRKAREEGWLKYRTAMGRQIGLDAERLSDHMALMTVTSPLLCDGKFPASALNRQTDQVQRRCSSPSPSPDFDESDDSGHMVCTTFCHSTFDGNGPETARAFMQEVEFGLRTAQRQYTSGEAEALVLRVYDAMALFDPDFPEACPRASMAGQAACLTRLEAMLLAFESTQFVGNAVSPVVRDKLGRGDGLGMAPVTDRVLFEVSARRVTIKREYHWTVKTYDEASGVTQEVGVHFVGVAAAPDYVFAAELYFDSLEDFASFYGFVRGEIMKHSTYKWSRDNPEGAVYQGGKGRVWEYPGYRPGALYAPRGLMDLVRAGVNAAAAGGIL